VHALSVFAFLAFLIYLAGMAALHVLPTGQEPLYNTVSDYARSAFGTTYRALTALNALGVGALAWAFATAGIRPAPAAAGIAALAVLALCRLGMVGVITDLSGTRVTASGSGHHLLAIASFVAAVCAATFLTGSLQRAADHPLLAVLAGLSFPLAVLQVVGLTPWFRRIFGLLERLFLLDVGLWLLAAAQALLVWR